MLGKIKLSLPYPDALLLAWLLGLVMVLWAGVSGSKDGVGREGFDSLDKTIRTEVIQNRYWRSLDEIEAALKLQPRDPRLIGIQEELKFRLDK